MTLLKQTTASSGWAQSPSLLIELIWRGVGAEEGTPGVAKIVAVLGVAGYALEMMGVSGEG